jgi:hypothetical protein
MSNPLSRVDGHLKVTGAAKYPYEFPLPDPAQAFFDNEHDLKGADRQD